MVKSKECRSADCRARKVCGCLVGAAVLRPPELPALLFLPTVVGSSLRTPCSLRNSVLAPDPMPAPELRARSGAPCPLRTSVPAPESGPGRFEYGGSGI